MLLIFRILTFWLLVSWAVDQHVRWKLAWLLWWIMSWQQTWVRRPFWMFQACQQLLRKVVWFLLAHLYILVGRVKSHSVHPSLFGEAPGSGVAYGWSALRTWLVLGLFWPPLLVKACWWNIWVSNVNRGGCTWICLLFHNARHPCLVSIRQYHSTRAPTEALLHDIKGTVHNTDGWAVYVPTTVIDLGATDIKNTPPFLCKECDWVK